MNTQSPQKLNDSKHYSFIQRIARAAGEELRSRFRKDLTITAKPDRSIVTDADLASERVILASIRAEWPGDAILSEEAGTAGGAKPKAGQHVWIIDPLDGTSNFANGYPFYSVSIARCRADASGKVEPVAGAVYDVSNDVLYYAEEGCGAYANGQQIGVSGARAFASSFLVTGFYYQTGDALEREVARFLKVAKECPAVRRDGSAALDLALVASGIFDAFWENGLQPWDVAAGILLVREAGGIVRNYAENSYDFGSEGLVAGTRTAVAEIALRL